MTGRGHGAGPGSAAEAQSVMNGCPIALRW
jgi:hypothetical protein